MEYLVAILRWKKHIAIFVVAATVVSIVVSFLLPKWYRSDVTLLPPRTQGLLGGLSPFAALLKDFTPTGSAARMGGSGSVNYLAILKSRRAWEQIIRRYDLMTVYDIDDGSMEKTLKEFESNLNIEVSEDGSIDVGILDRDSLRAAAMANGMVETLNAIAIELGTTEARSNREFLGKRVADTRTELAAAEDALKRYQEQKGVIILSDDAKSTAAAIGELFAKKVRLDVELSVLQKTTGGENAAYKQLLLEQQETQRKLSTFPEIGITSFRLYRDVLIPQKVLEFLIPMYEQARLEEQKDIPVVIVLDKAVPAEKKARPRRLIIVASSALSSLILALMAVAAVVRKEQFKHDSPATFVLLRSAMGRRVRS